MKKRILTCFLVFMMSLGIGLPLVATVTSQPVGAAVVAQADTGHTHTYKITSRKYWSGGVHYMECISQCKKCGYVSHIYHRYRECPNGAWYMIF